jgi:uncharacterized protein YbbC (DUF1343 family)
LGSLKWTTSRQSLPSKRSTKRISAGEAFESMLLENGEISGRIRDPTPVVVAAGGTGRDNRKPRKSPMGSVLTEAHRLILLILAAAVLSSTGSYVEPQPAVLPGIDVLRETGAGSFRSKRLGLITNHTGRTFDGKPSWEVLQDELGLRLVALYSPEHGFAGHAAAGDRVDPSTEATSGLHVYSLYGDARKPTPEMLRDIDTLVFDIQDIGVRFYTYISTLKLAMEAAADAGVDVVVLDRPNPNTGIRVEGPVLDPRFESFVGIAPIALLHGMSVGELARMFNEEGMLEDGKRVRLEVIRARGWRRDMWWEDTGLPWRQTSPNIRKAEAAVAYPAIGLFEAVNVSEGRGTEETFLLAGAPWIEAGQLVPALNAMKLPGVRFLPEVFTPRSSPAAPRPIYPNETCRGFRLEVVEPDRFQAVRTGLSALATIRRMYPDKAQWEVRDGTYFLDRLLGTDVPRKKLDAGETVDAVLNGLKPGLEAFERRRSRYLMYP